MKLRISGLLAPAAFAVACCKRPNASSALPQGRNTHMSDFKKSRTDGTDPDCRPSVTRYSRRLWCAIAECAMTLAFGLFQTAHAQSVTYNYTGNPFNPSDQNDSALITQYAGPGNVTASVTLDIPSNFSGTVIECSFLSCDGLSTNVSGNLTIRARGVSISSSFTPSSSSAPPGDSTSAGFYISNGVIQSWSIFGEKILDPSVLGPYGTEGTYIFTIDDSMDSYLPVVEPPRDGVLTVTASLPFPNSEISHSPGDWTLASVQTGTTPPLQITTTYLPSAAGGQPYGPTPIMATGGSGRGYNWTVTSGSLPPGFTFSAEGSCGSACTDVDLSSTGSPAAPAGLYSFTSQVTDSAGNLSAQPLTLIVYPYKVNVQLFWAQYMDAYFNSGFPTLEQAAQKCGFANFDWVQTITQSPAPLCPNGVCAENPFLNPLYAPYSDPPPGGYMYQFDNTPPAYIFNSLKAYAPNFANAYPFYYSPLDVPNGCALGPPVPPGTAPNCVTKIENGGALYFHDVPKNTACALTSTCFAITTQLVGVCGSLPSAVCSSPSTPTAPLYQWTYYSNYTGSTGGVYGVQPSDLFPPDPGSGAGGVTVTSINGVQLPLPVSPSQITTTASGLAYSRVSQTFNGTVTLTNISSGPIGGPLQVLMTGVTPRVTLANGTGDLSGTPYLTIPTLALAPGQSITVSVQFKNPSNATINLSPAIYSGSI